MASKCDSIRNLKVMADATELLQTDVNGKYLKPLDETLRCRICFEYFENCMVTKCSHNYCSVCIRRYMQVKAQCPICFQDASEPELRNNRLIDEVLRAYLKIRDTLKEALLNQSTSQTVLLKPVESVQVDIDEKCIRPHKAITREEAIIKDEVTCPVCYKLVLKDTINSHLDLCLKKTELDTERKTLPKLVYHLLSDKDIRKKLKEHGLNTSGDRKTIVRRHKNFITLYNANCDSLTPKPVSEILLEIERQELEERIYAVPKPIQVHKRSSPSEIEAERTLYIRQNQSHFNALIEDVHQRQIKETKIKLEVQDDYDYIGKSTSFQDKDTKTDAGICFSPYEAKEASPSYKMKEVKEEIKGESDSDECYDVNIKHGKSQFKITQIRTISKEKASIQQSDSEEQLSTSDEKKTVKIRQLKSLHKRKKALNKDRPGSPKRNA